MKVFKVGMFTAATAGLVVATALSVSPSTARAEDEEAPNCTRLGCSGGAQLCATYSVQVGLPGVGSTTVTYYCYQAAT
jgi:hypothetical protein